MLTFVPSFKLPDIKVEIIFLIDRSGSMDGIKVEMAKNALKVKFALLFFVMGSARVYLPKILS